MRVVITGANGYIGLNLADYLVNKGHNVVKIDKVCSMPAEALPLDFFKTQKGKTAIVHLAAMSGIKACEEDKTMAINDNVVSAAHVFEMASYFGIPVTFASSQAAKEPSNTYGFLKKICEQMAVRTGVNVLRLANVYGGRHFLERKNTAIANFINTKYPDPITITGTGDQSRDFIHVDEVCRAIELCLDKRRVFVDIGTGIPRKIIAVATWLQKRNIIYDDYEKAGVQSSVADIEPARKKLGFLAEDRLLDYLSGHK